MPEAFRHSDRPKIRKIPLSFNIEKSTCPGSDGYQCGWLGICSSSSATYPDFASVFHNFRNGAIVLAILVGR